MQRALGEYQVLGVRTTIPFHRWLMEHEPFAAGDLDTEIVARDWQPEGNLSDLDAETVERAALLAALAEHFGRDRRRAAAAPSEEAGRWVSFARRAGLRVP